MTRWIEIAKTTDCPPGAGKELVAEDTMIALFNVDGQFYALDGVCPHQGGPLGQGCLQHAIVTCPWHGWQFDVRSGEHQLNRNLRQPTFDLRIEDGAIFVNLDR